MTQKSFGLIGCPLGHSMSPFLQGRLFSAAGVQAEYRLFELAPGTLASALPALILLAVIIAAVIVCIKKARKKRKAKKAAQDPTPPQDPQ